MSDHREPEVPPYSLLWFIRNQTEYFPRYGPLHVQQKNGEHGVYFTSSEHLSDWHVITDRSIAACVCFLNFILLMGLCCMKSKDKKLFRFHLINLILISFLSGGVILAIELFERIQGVHSFDDFTCRSFAFAKSVLDNAYPLCLLEIHLDRFFCLISPFTYRHRVHCAIGAILALMPWVVGMAMSLPEIILQGVKPPFTEGLSLFRCKVDATGDIYRLTLFVRYIPPGLVVVSFLLTLMIFFVLLSPKCSADRDDRGSLLNSMVALLLVDIFFFLMQMITQTIGLVAAICPSGACNRGYFYNIHKTILARWLHNANLGLNPILWLCDRDVRRGHQALCCLECITKKKGQTA